MKRTFVIFLLMALFSTGCLSGFSLLGDREDGTLAVFLTDAPANVEAVNVLLTKITVNGPEGWETVFEGSANVNLLDLRFTDQLIQEVQLPSGAYSQLRLYIDEAEVVFDDSSSKKVKIPSASSSGLKIDYDFEVVANAVTELLIDIDANSIVEELRAMPESSQHEYMLNPVIKITERTERAVIGGRVILGDASIDQDIIVRLSVDGQIYMETFALQTQVGDKEAGSFQFNSVAAGTYTIQAFTSDGTMTTEAEEITVAAGETYDNIELILLAQ